MEQRRVYGKSQWYHEPQSRQQAADVLPLVPDAAIAFCWIWPFPSPFLPKPAPGFRKREASRRR